MRIGVLAAQGAFSEHIAVLHKLDIEAWPVRLPQQLTGLDGLIIPGGESTSISKLMNSYQLTDRVSQLAGDGFPVLGTCAGMILLAQRVSGSTVTSLGVMDIAVRRNAFGRQRESFETELHIPVLGDEPFPGVFIRAPLIEEVGEQVEMLSWLADGAGVAARQGKLLVAAFHPELTDDLRFHQYFLDIITGER